MSTGAVGDGEGFTINPAAVRAWKRYPAYKDSGVEWLGEVPAGWDIKKLAWITKCLDGKRIPLNTEERGRIQGQFPYWGANSVVDYIDKWLFDEPLVLLGEDGAPFFEPYKDVAFYVQGKIWVNNHAHVLRATKVDPRYLAHSLNAVDFRPYINGSTRDKLTQAEMNSILIPYPIITEQHVIAAFLDRETARIDALIEKKQRFIELLEEKRQAVITHAVTKGLDPDAEMKDSGVEWIGEVPVDWEVKKLKHVFKNFDSRRIPINSEDRGKLEKIYPYYGASGIIDYVDDYIFDEPLILVAEDGANLLSRSTPLAFVAEGRYWVNNHAHILKPRRGNLIYWEGALQSFDYTPLISGAAQPKLTTEKLSTIVLPLPPIEAQNEISHFIKQEGCHINSLNDFIRRQIEKLEELRTALISAAVTGKIDVRGEGGAA